MDIAERNGRCAIALSHGLDCIASLQAIFRLKAEATRIKGSSA
jgi:hypothetical protein